MLSEIVWLAVTFILGGGISQGVRAWRESQKIQREAETLGLKTPVEIESIQVAGMDTLIKNLQSENEMLREDRNYWRGMYNAVRNEVDALAKEMDVYRKRISELQSALDAAGQHSPGQEAAGGTSIDL